MASNKKKSGTSKTAKIAKIVNKPKDPVDERILEIVFKRGEISVPDLTTEIEVSRETIRRHTTLLQNEGFIVKIKGLKNNAAIVKWIGGTPAIESELLNATNNRIAASLLAESFDSMITGAFSVFSLLFEDDCWEVLMNMKEGLTDLELQKNIGSTTNLDTVRRVLIICNAHNFIKINIIRNPAGRDIIQLFEPLYRIDEINREYVEYLVLIRGLASAIQYKITTKKTPEYSHLYENILDNDIRDLINLKKRITKEPVGKEFDLLNKLLFNYDFASDLDNIYRDGNWKMDIKQSKYLKLGENDRIIISDSFNK